MRLARLVVVAGLAVAVGADALAARAASREEILDRGNAAYGRGRFDEAAEAYRELVSLGVRDFRVEYNLGCAELKAGHLGPAVLHLERARRLAPADGDVLSNLAYARDLIRDRVDFEPDRGELAAVVTLQDRIGADRQALVALILVWLLAAALIAAGSRPGGFTPAAGWIVTVLVVVLAITVASWSATYERNQGTPRAVVLAPAADALAGPAETNARVFTVHEGTVLEIRAERDGFVQIALPNGLNGWVRRDALDVV